MKSIATEVCIKCGAELPFTAEFFVVCRRTASGLVRRCKPCDNKRGKEAAARDPEGTSEKRRAYRQANLEKLRAGERASKERHRDAVNQRQNARRAANLDAARSQGRVTYQRRKDTQLAAMKEWRRRNPDYEAQRRLERPELHRAKNHNRRARLKAAEGSFTPEQWRQKLAQYAGRCHWCGGVITGPVHVEHVIPLARGGTNFISNVVPSCASCNAAKGTKLPHEFSGRLF